MKLCCNEERFSDFDNGENNNKNEEVEKVIKNNKK